jgi:predicted GNAT family N-acyltransferase
MMGLGSGEEASMPFFVVSGASPDAAQVAPDRFSATGNAGHATREAAEREVAQRRGREPAAALVVVEAATPIEAIVRAHAPGGALPELRIEEVRTGQQMESALSVRRRVFIEEQGVSEDEEIDQYDAEPEWGRSVVHVLGRLGSLGMPVATGRLLLDYPPGEYVHIGRVAVLPEFRGYGYGRVVMEALQEEARRRGRPGITLAAQLHAIPFYERLGYVARGEVFLDAGIEHRWMDLAL